MAKDDSYEIMPYREIVELKRQIAELQQKAGDASSKELLSSMAALTKSMNNMLQLFSSAAEEMKLEEKTESELSQKIGPLIEKVEKLEEQNKTIAEGLVAIADMVKETRGEKKPKEKPKPLPPKQPEPPEKPSFEDLPSLEPPEPEEESFGLPPLEPPKPMRGPPGPSFFSTGSPRVVARRPMPPLGGPPPMPPPSGRLMPPLGGPPPIGPGADFGELPPLPPLEEEPKKKGLFGMFKKR